MTQDVNVIKGNVGRIYVLKGGETKDPLRMSDFHPLSNTSGLLVHIEDGGGQRSIGKINFAPQLRGDNDVAYHWFPMYFRGFVEATVSSESAPRTFAQYFVHVPSQILALNLNKKKPMDVALTMVTQGGVNYLGQFSTLLELNTEHAPTEDLSNDMVIGFVWEVSKRGFYQVEWDASNSQYMWKKISDGQAYVRLQQKQYNLSYMTVQGGYAPQVERQALKDPQFEALMLEINDINSRLYQYSVDFNDLEIRVVALEDRNVFTDDEKTKVSKIIIDGGGIQALFDDGTYKEVPLIGAFNTLENRVTTVENDKVDKSGDTMSGDLNMSGNKVKNVKLENAELINDLNAKNKKIVNLANGENAGDGVNKGQLNLKLDKEIIFTTYAETEGIVINGKNSISEVDFTYWEKTNTGFVLTEDMLDDENLVIKYEDETIYENKEFKNDWYRFYFVWTSPVIAFKKGDEGLYPILAFNLNSSGLAGTPELGSILYLYSYTNPLPEPPTIYITQLALPYTREQTDTKKLDKIWNDITSQSLTNLNDEFVLNRGGEVYKTTLANMLNNVVPVDIFVVVSALPEVGLSNKIYLVSSEDPELQNTLDEFIWVENDWEMIGNVSVDLSNYFTKTEINSMLESKVDKNANITAGTHPKITYDAKGLVTGGGALVEGDIPNLAPTKITQNATHRFVTDTQISTWNNKQDELIAGANINIIGNTISASGGSGGGDGIDLDEIGYLNHAANIFYDSKKNDKFKSAWEDMKEVDGAEIERVSTTSTQYGTLQYPNGEDNGVIIPDSVTSIGNNAFRNWSSNKQPLVIPNSVTSIGSYAFYSWEANNQQLVIPNSVTSIGSYVFYNWQANNQPLIIPNSVTSIGSYVFYNWQANNQQLVIPNSVTSIGNNAFRYWSSNNQPLIIPNSVTSIGDDAFRSWLVNNQPLVIPNSVISIGNNAFRDWSSNNQPLIIPNSVTSIGDNAFRSWQANNQPLVIPNSVTSIGSSAFENWTSVPYVEMKSETPPTLGSSTAFSNQNDAPIYVPHNSVDTYKDATNWSALASRIFSINDK